MLVGLKLLLVEGGVVLAGGVQGVQAGEGGGGRGRGRGLGRVQGGRHQGRQVGVGARGQAGGGERGKTRESCLSGEGGGWREVAGAVESRQTAGSGPGRVGPVCRGGPG